MLALTHETEALARRVAAAKQLPVEDAVRRALENEARAAGLELGGARRRRMSADEMLALGGEIAALPLLDPRSAREIVDDVDAP